MKSQDLWRDPHGEGPFQPAALVLAPLRAPLEVAGCVCEEKTDGVERDPRGAFGIPTDAANGFVQGCVQ